MSELGELAANPAVPQAAFSDSAGVPCYQCEYDLRGLPRDGRCPECGEPIETSYRREEERQRRGGLPPLLPGRWARNMFLACAMLLLFAVMEQAQAIFIVVPIPGIKSQGWPQWCTAIAGLTGALCMAVGLWLFGSREPAMVSRGNNRFTRWGIRFAAIAPFLVSGLAMWLARTMAPSDFFSYWRRVGVAESCVSAFATVLVLLRLVEIARRSMQGRLRVWTCVLMIIAPIATIAQTIFHPEIDYAPSSGWLLYPDPLLGFGGMIVTIPVTLIRRGADDWLLVTWAFQALLSAAIVVVLFLSARQLRCVRRQQLIDESAAG